LGKSLNLKFVKKIANVEEFASADENKSLKKLVFKREIFS